ncbi:high mobility group (HMG) box domain containing protein [Entamoeba nuttalli P19]|uniref:High mobility group (HMG) box domain containing protein n=2 Tax=Entamoeba nuttalli TaxID=412467 RepID=K2GBI1_ENTNP|nr:high mobility group (HMG) box domain containing protein [Entamoeba nuttalli P19]EKE39891.1 high mobility group (HMG) box domain containing protein [Entamoeba nuttalli P19]|eukprot:XP_008857773.1 high mobility group (HMG) box domain containing protein [Entamoeba nuttalli P19]
MSTLSSMWKQLPDEDKERYQELAKQNKAKDIKTNDQPAQDQPSSIPTDTQQSSLQQ